MGGDNFGHSVAIDGDTWLIGAYNAAYVYTSNGSQVAKLTADSGYFGRSVAIDADIAVIGAYGDDDNGLNSGSAYVYEQQADGTWQQVAKLTANDGASEDRFGWSVATSGGIAVIGATGDDDNGDGSGSAYVYGSNAATGACCVTSGCDLLTEASCTSLGGTWLGEGSLCDDCPASCAGDITGDGHLGIQDLLLMLEAWGPCP